MTWALGRRVRAIADDLRGRRAYTAALRSGDDAEADRRARALLARDPSDHALWFDLGLAAKRRRDWAAAVAMNERALDAMATVDDGEPAAWNLGIAATALGDWPRARRAWRAFGLAVPDGEGPLVLARLGRVPVRLNPTETELGEAPLTIDGEVRASEVVWAERLSPAHARVLSVPSPESGHRWGDVVLNDGVPHGERWDGDRWVPVFDELARLERSEHATWATAVEAPARADSEALAWTARAAGLAAEDWTADLRVLCRECSEGRPHHDHGDGEPVWSSTRDVGVAAPDAASARTVLDGWVSAGTGRAYGELRQVG